ncbi:type II toxin-antitoxin system HicB family antitoxin [Vagococcus fluvialis]|uniref:type II toxin-antitoxin system HicB family antitoxin n=1 Tax=Vagococcus fluvialis TaxID=2738 RepID=UPI0037971E88
MVVEYVALFKKKEDRYCVSFPDIPDILTQGESLESAKLNAVECLKVSLSTKIKLPKSSEIDLLAEEYPKHILSLIQVEL